MTYTPFEIESSWRTILQEELAKPYMLQLAAFLEEERQKETIFPPRELVFNAFRLTPYPNVKVVIVGQDPYHGPQQAHGLSFSVPQGIAPPPSLKNIYKELKEDLQIDPPEGGCLIPWAKQGVLLLNALFTVRQGQPLSHQGKGWEKFTDAVIQKLAERKEPLVFLLWGKYAQDKFRSCTELKKNQHLVLTAAHPSPFSVQNFYGCKHFSKANEFLVKQQITPINWDLRS